jgi:peroxiredoxin
LRRWEALRLDFEALGVALVAISPDTVAEARAMRERGSFGLTLLSDASLAVVDRYGVRHAKGLAAPSAGRGMLRPLAIPTTFLIDAEGVVRWIDQAEDYRVRSDAPRVLAAVHAALAHG